MSSKHIESLKKRNKWRNMIKSTARLLRKYPRLVGKWQKIITKGRRSNWGIRCIYRSNKWWKKMTSRGGSSNSSNRSDKQTGNLPSTTKTPLSIPTTAEQHQHILWERAFQQPSWNPGLSKVVETTSNKGLTFILPGKGLNLKYEMSRFLSTIGSTMGRKGLIAVLTLTVKRVGEVVVNDDNLKVGWLARFSIYLFLFERSQFSLFSYSSKFLFFE